MFITTQQEYMHLVADKVGAREAAELQRTLASNASANAAALDRHYLSMRGTEGTAARGVEYFAVQTQKVEPRRCSADPPRLRPLRI